MEKSLAERIRETVTKEALTVAQIAKKLRCSKVAVYPHLKERWKGAKVRQGPRGPEAATYRYRA